MGNMTSKVSSVYNNPDRLLGENINYSLEYEYDQNYAHRVKRIGSRYYSYDENGNVVLEQDEPITAQDEQRYEIQELGENLYGVEYGWALENEDEQNKVGSSGVYKRRYRWNERNLMQESSENRQSVYYRYGADGQRALKSSNQSETLYFNTMWSWLHNSSAYNTERESKHIYLGSERLVTRTNGAGTQGNTYTAQVSTYYYHSDHLGSAQLITDNEGKEYERIEYTPYGEYWIEKRAPEHRTLPFKFTGKERDEETGLYYYGARYLDPKTGRWLSADPALGEYMAGSNSGAGGIYNQVNFNLYHYAGNNPIKYTDPDGKKLTLTVDKSDQSMNTKFEINGVTLIKFNSKVTTHVVPDGDTTQDPAANENINRWERATGNYWTQIPNGEHTITGVKKSDDKTVVKTDPAGKTYTEADLYGKEQLKTDASQMLPVYDAQRKPELDSSGKQKSRNDSGYNVHFTRNSNTAGCVGIKNKIKMWINVKLYQINEKLDPNTSKLKVQD